MQSQTIMTIEENEKPCWGCGLSLLLPPHATVFKCGWCGAITDLQEHMRDSKYLWLRRARDRCFVGTLFLFMLFLICGGVWAVYPVVFSVSYLCGIVHCLIAAVLSVATMSMVACAAFKSPGKAPAVRWGSYPLVGQNQLENYKFCHHCAHPKCPRVHHCRTCRMCVLDMDHHCPFIGNCVGAGNHWHFIMFLLCAVISTVYVAIMAGYACARTWPHTTYQNVNLNRVRVWSTVKDLVLEFFSVAVFLSPRGLVLVYICMAGVSVNIGLSVLLWQQLYYIYEGNTYIGHLTSQESREKDCKNVVRFFECPFIVSRFLSFFGNSTKTHSK